MASTTPLRSFKAPAAALALLASLSACTNAGGGFGSGPTATPSQEPLPPLVAEQDAAIEFGAGEAFAACRAEALDADASARASAQPGQYLLSARIAEACVNTSTGGVGVAQDERMRVAALAIQNHAKGGDAVRARELLTAFDESFPDADLYYADGSAFTETMGMALGMASDEATGRFSTANVNPTLKAETRRVRYWAQN